MKKIVSAQYLMLFVFGIALCLPQAASAFPKGQFTSPFKRIFLRAILDLTREQRAALVELKAETAAQAEPLEEELEALGRELPEMLLAEELNIDGAEAMLQDMADLKCAIASIEAHAGLEGFQIVTSEKRFLTSAQRQALVAVAEDALDLFEYISDYPGWEKIKDDFKEYIVPILEEVHPGRIGRKPLLDLTDEQIEDFEQLKDDTDAATEPLEEELRALALELLVILMAEEPVIEDAEATLARILALQCQHLTIGTGSVLAGVQLLTPEQRQGILEKIEKRKPRWWMGRSRAYSDNN